MKKIIESLAVRCTVNGKNIEHVTPDTLSDGENVVIWLEHGCTTQPLTAQDEANLPAESVLLPFITGGQP